MLRYDQHSEASGRSKREVRLLVGRRKREANVRGLEGVARVANITNDRHLPIVLKKQAP